MTERSPFRSPLEQNIVDTSGVINKNVEWMDSPFTKFSYVISIFLCYGALHISQFFTPAESWTVLSIIHGVVSFVLLHWVKGNPDEASQGIYNGDTLYEQMDDGIPWTQNKKFLMLIPALLAWVSCHSADYKPVYLVVNIGIFFILTIAKIPAMHHVRIFGINSTPGIDTAMEYDPPSGKEKTR